MKQAIWLAVLALLAAGCEDGKKDDAATNATAKGSAASAATGTASAASGSSCDEYIASLKKCAGQSPAFKKTAADLEKALNAATNAQQKETTCRTGLATLKQNPSCKL